MSEPLDREALSALDFETPFFVFSRAKMIEQLHAFKASFPGAAIHYAMKANSEAEVLRTAYGGGAGFEVASRFELDLLRPLGVPPERIIYGTAVKPTSHIKALHEYGVDRFAFDSVSELEKIAGVAPDSRVYVRIAVDDSSSVFRFSEKFGASRDDAVSLLLGAERAGLQPYGISFHVGSQAGDPLAWERALRSLRPVMRQLEAVGIRLRAINIGGGYPCAYASLPSPFTIRDIACTTLEAYRALPYHPQLILEPGRALVADAVVLVTSIIARIDRKTSTWLFTDAGVYNALYETLAFQGSTRYRITSLRVSDAATKLFALAGPTGDSPDVITREALLPGDLTAGDKLVFHAAGAYSLSVSSRFNGFPQPRVYVADTAAARECVA